MKRNRRKKAALLNLGLPVVVLCLLAWLTWLEVRQSRLNHALILALYNHEIAHVVALLHQGADPNARDVPECPLTWRDLLNRWLHLPSAIGLADTALMVAVRAGRRDEVDLLLHSYVDSVSSTIDAPTRRRLVKLLLDRGADIRATDEDGQSPLVAACDQDAEIAYWLMERVAPHNSGVPFISPP